MFRLFRSHCLDLRIAKLQMDFEVAAHIAAKEVFPEAEVRGCRFHLAQAWFRKLGRLGLHSVYNNKTSKTAIWLKSIFGLPGLEPEEVERFFNQELKSQAPERPAVAAFILYLSQTYIAADAKFPPTMWAGIMDGGKHTTNGCESFHRHFGRGFVSPHPNMYDWLHVLKMSHKRSLINFHAENKTGKRNNERLTQTINLLNQNYESKLIDTMTYVKLISLNLMAASAKRCHKRAK